MGLIGLEVAEIAEAASAAAAASTAASSKASAPSSHRLHRQNHRRLLHLVRLRRVRRPGPGLHLAALAALATRPPPDSDWSNSAFWRSCSISTPAKGFVVPDCPVTATESVEKSELLASEGRVAPVAPLLMPASAVPASAASRARFCAPPPVLRRTVPCCGPAGSSYVLLRSSFRRNPGSQGQGEIGLLANRGARWVSGARLWSPAQRRRARS